MPIPPFFSPRRTRSGTINSQKAVSPTLTKRQCKLLGVNKNGRELTRNVTRGQTRVCQGVGFSGCPLLRAEGCLNTFAWEEGKHLNKCGECYRYERTVRQRQSRARVVKERSKTIRPHAITYNSKVNFDKLTRLELIARCRNMAARLKYQDKQIARAKKGHINVTTDADTNQDLISLWDHSHKHPVLLQSIIQKDETGKLAQFYNDQKKYLELKDTRGMRWSVSTIRLCLSVYMRSTSSYKALRSNNILQLPSKRTLSHYLANNRFECGVNEEQGLKAKARYALHKSRYPSSDKAPPRGVGMVTFDEIKIMGGLTFQNDGKLSGFATSFEDLETMRDIFQDLKEDEDVKNIQANYINQFLWRDMTSKFDVIGPHYAGNRSIDYVSVYAQFWEAVGFFHRYGFETHVGVCDGASGNVKFIKTMCKGLVDSRTQPMEPWCFNHFSNRKVFFYIDPVHQLKSMRNALFSSSESGAKDFTLRGASITWRVIKEALDRKTALADRGQGWHNVSNLTTEVVELTSWTKMRVNLAKVVFNNKFRAELAAHISEQRASNRPDLHAEITAKFLKVNYDIFLSKVMNKAAKISSIDDPFFVELETHLDFFYQWKADVESRVEAGGGTESDKTDKKTRFFLAKETWLNIRIFVRGWIACMKDFLKRFPEYYIHPARLTQSCLEALFSRVRQMGGSSNNPSYNEYTSFISVDVMRNDHIPLSKKANVDDQDMHMADATLSRKRRMPHPVHLSVQNAKKIKLTNVETSLDFKNKISALFNL